LLEIINQKDTTRLFQPNLKKFEDFSFNLPKFLGLTANRLPQEFKVIENNNT